MEERTEGGIDGPILKVKQTVRKTNEGSYLKVINRKLQHVPEDITEYLCLSLDENILIIQWLNHFWFYLETKHTHTNSAGAKEMNRSNVAS